MCVKQQGLSPVVIFRVNSPDVVSLPVYGEPIAVDGALHDVGSLVLVAAC